MQEAKKATDLQGSQPQQLQAACTLAACGSTYVRHSRCASHNLAKLILPIVFAVYAALWFACSG